MSSKLRIRFNAAYDRNDRAYARFLGIIARCAPGAPMSSADIKRVFACSRRIDRLSGHLGALRCERNARLA